MPSPELGPTEFHDTDSLREYLDDGGSLAGVRIQDLDLGEVERELLAREDLAGLVVFGGTLPDALAEHLREHRAIVFPASRDAPVSIFRAGLYSAEQLYEGLATSGYSSTPDARAYRWLIDTQEHHDAYATLQRAIHDDSISDALDEWSWGTRMVGVMGGHGLGRGSDEYASAAQLGFDLAEAGFLVATGGGPGAMEAANLGARAPSGSTLAAALKRLKDTPGPEAGIDAWATSAFEALELFRSGRAGAGPRSLGIPTWYYGHEPPNVFAQGIAKYFSNALREDGLLARSGAGVVILPGAAGTVQEIFQQVTRLYYAPLGTELPPLVLVGRDYWQETLPVMDLLAALGRDRAMAHAVRLVGTTGEAVAAITGRLG